MYTVEFNGTKLSIPTSISEISAEYLKNCTNHVTPAPEYSVVALCYREKLAIVLNSSKKKDNINSSVVPLFVKSGVSESDFCNGIKTGNPIVVTGSDLSMGIHINSPINSISLNEVVAFCSQNNDINKQAFKDQRYCYFVEFKLIPNCDIKGVIGEVEKYINPYIEISKDSKSE